MKTGGKYLFVLVISLLTLVIFPFPVKAEDGKAPSGIASAARDREVLERFRAQSPQRMDEVDRKLAEALALYYDGQYGQALPIFNQISSEVETTEIMWWIGTSAMNTGNLKLAIDKFNRLLAVDPSLGRVRLELATAYFQLGKYNDARRELEAVRATRPPDAVVKNIDRMIAAIDEAAKRFFWNVRFSSGIQSDNNVSAGPGNPTIDTSFGPVILAQNSAKVGDTGYTANLSANALYKIMPGNGLAWNTTLDYYSIMYSKYTEYDYLSLGGTTGPWWIGHDFVAKLPVGYTVQYFGDSDQRLMTSQQWIDHPRGALTPADFLKRNLTLGQDGGMNRLSDIWHVDPSFEYFFNRYFSLKGQYVYIWERYAKRYNPDTRVIDDRRQFDNDSQRWELTPSLYFLNRNHIFSLTLGYEDSSADADVNGFRNNYISASYYMRFPTQTEFLLRYQYDERKYGDTPPLYTDKRRDSRSIFTAVLNQNFLKHYFASLTYFYLDNRSNADVYTYDKQTITFSIGAYF